MNYNYSPKARIMLALASALTKSGLGEGQTYSHYNLSASELAEKIELALNAVDPIMALSLSQGDSE